MNRSTFFSLGLFVSFFLPWINLGLFTFNGYDIPISLEKMSRVTEFFGGEDLSAIYGLTYSIYLIPILTFYKILNSLVSHKSTNRDYDFMTSFFVSIFFIFLVIGFFSLEVSVFGIGFFLTIIFSLLGILFGNNDENEIKSDKVGSINEIIEEKEVVSFENRNLFNELTQLSNLREKNVISEEIFEKERGVILAKIQKRNYESERNFRHSLKLKKTLIDEENPVNLKDINGKQPWYNSDKVWVKVIVFVSFFVILVIIFSIVILPELG